MANTVTKSGNSIYINGTFVYTFTNSPDYELAALQALFSDPDSDLDFITPTYDMVHNCYAVCCPLVRKNQGQITYFYNDAFPSVSRKLYNTSNATTTLTADSISLIHQIPASKTAPWYEALKLANAIRYAASLNYDCLRETSPSTLAKLAVPTNTSTTESTVISSSASVQFYGHPDQGTSQGATSYSSSLGGIYVENIASPRCGNADVLHPQDLTAAMTSTNNWNTLYKNKYVKVQMALILLL